MKLKTSGGAVFILSERTDLFDDIRVTKPFNFILGIVDSVSQRVALVRSVYYACGLLTTTKCVKQTHGIVEEKYAQRVYIM